MTLRGFAHAAALLLALATAAPAAAEEPLNADQKDAVRALVREVLRENPELVMEALQTLQARQEQAKQDAMAKMVVIHRDQLVNDPDSPVGGNPNGDVTIVEFMDYRCSYCKRVFESLQALFKEDDRIRFVVKELPILGPDSVLASKAALTVWKTRPDRYMEFHSALMSARGALSDQRILKIAADMGLDAAPIGAGMKSTEHDDAIERNVALALALGISGTPAFVIGDQLVPGAVGIETLRGLVEQARKG